MWFQLNVLCQTGKEIPTEPCSSVIAKKGYTSVNMYRRIHHGNKIFYTHIIPRKALD